MDVLFERRVVALFGVVEVNEEEDVRPDVVFLVDVVLKTLAQNRHQCDGPSNAVCRLRPNSTGTSSS